MVDEMTPEVICQSVQATPRPSTDVPACADELLEELGSAELFKRVLAIGYMDWQGFEKSRRERLGEKYGPSTVREVATKFGISTSRLMDLRRGAAVGGEGAQRGRMLKAEGRGEAEGRAPAGSRAASPEGRPRPSRPPPRSGTRLQQEQSSRSFSGPPDIPKVNRPGGGSFLNPSQNKRNVLSSI